MHLDDERVQRLLHGELEPAGEQLAHLVGCEVCRSLVDEARAEEHSVFGLLREVDHPAPDIDPQVLLPALRQAPPRWARRAAAVALVTAAAGVAYAAPGSPLPGVLQRLVAAAAPTRPPFDLPPEPEEAAPSGAGIAVAPGDRLTIRFLVDRDAAATAATLTLTDGDEVVVRTVEGVATFTSDEDHLSVRSAGPASFEILIPSSAPSVDVLSGDTPAFRKRADVVTEAQPGPDGRYTLTLSPSP
jgi:hypothetical protein